MEEKDLKQIEKLFEKGFAEGFKQAFGRIWEHNLEPAFNALNERIDKLEARIAQVEQRLTALEAKVTNYLELSDKRYLELKRKNLILAKWIQVIAEKTGVKIDLKELEDFSS